MPDDGAERVGDAKRRPIRQLVIDIGDSPFNNLVGNHQRGFQNGGKPPSTFNGEFFGSSRPAATIVEVSRPIDPAILLEVEVDAILTEEGVRSEDPW